ncbi:MAG: nucleotide exchange factor GrpE [Candidatus Omnitrophica bacterium]|nr:nucleotide exchange factor GrpE [Candidatus Omnitrophota bacterium]
MNDHQPTPAENSRAEKHHKGQHPRHPDPDAEDNRGETVTISQKEYAQLRDKEKESLEIREKMLRLQADFENIRKRLDREKIEFIKYSNEQIIKDLIPFVDDFQRAFTAADKTNDFNVLHRGVEMILNHLVALLKDKGVSAMDVVGKPFNPSYHEAMLQVESDEYPENTVVEELQKGYLLNDRVIRTAKVKVAKPKETSAFPDNGDGESFADDENP